MLSYRPHLHVQIDSSKLSKGGEILSGPIVQVLFLFVNGELGIWQCILNGNFTIHEHSQAGEREELKPNFTEHLHTLILVHTINIVDEVLPNRTKLVNVLLE